MTFNSTWFYGDSKDDISASVIRVLVAGGAGYIGSHACKALAQAGRVNFGVGERVATARVELSRGADPVHGIRMFVLGLMVM